LLQTPTRSRRSALALGAAVLVALSAAAPASAGPTTKILETCAEGRIPSGYSQPAYNKALRQMPPELSEYSDCSDLIHKAQLAAATGGGAGGPGGDASPASAVTPPTPAERRTLEHVSHFGNAPVQVGDEPISPGVVHVNIASALSTLPTPLLALLAFLLACAAFVLGRTLGLRLLRTRRHGS
jgi:hypothetical protein